MHEVVNPADLVEWWGAPIDSELLELALTHRSWAYENDTPHNERLEFLGDSLLGAIAAQKIFDRYADYTEGEMSKIKAASVSERSLAQIARGLDLGRFIRLGKGEEMSGGREKDSILADTVEALIAATFLSSDIDVTRRVVDRLISPAIESASKAGPALDWRTALEEKARELGMQPDISYVMDSEGPDHARRYTAHVQLGGVERGVGVATSQKAAKLAACEDAYANIVELAGEAGQLTS